MAGDFPQLIVQDWIERLRASADGFKFIGGAADLAAAEDQSVAAPAAYFYQRGEVPRPNEYGTGALSQQVTARMAVVIAVRNRRDPRGDAAQEELRPRRQEVLAALLGWAPNADSDPVVHAGGQLVKFSDQVLWWQDEFTTQFYRRVM